MRLLTLSTALAFAWSLPVESVEAQPTIRWQPDTAVLIQRGAGYGRMARLPDDSILCAYSRGRTIYVCRSTDDGRTWPDETLAVDYPQGHAANAELLVLRDGRVLLMYNERPTDGQSPFAVGVCASNDGGRVWQNHRQIYAAGAERRVGCWEPAAVELPAGEVQLFFANEKPYPHSSEQEITRLRSTDGGRIWLQPQAVSFRAGHRDGMPVPLLLAGGRRIALAIEDNGLSGRFKPAIISLPAAEPAESLPVSGKDNRRQSALVDPLPEQVYAGAPYLVQLPSGETVLSVQSTEGRDASHDFSNSRMVVYVGDAEATRFAGRSVPFELLTDAPGLWNALFVKDAKTITAISGTAIDGVKGLWAIDGHVE